MVTLSIFENGSSTKLVLSFSEHYMLSKDTKCKKIINEKNFQFKAYLRGQNKHFNDHTDE